MRVVHYLWSAQIGGIERLVLDLALAQREMGGVSPSVLLGVSRGEFLGDYRASALPLEAAGLRGGADISPGRGRRLARQFAGFDIVHLHAYHPLVAHAAGRSGARVVFTEHGAFGLRRPRTVSDRVKRILQRRFVNGGVDFVTFNSDHTRRTARALYGLAHVPQAVVYNGTRLDDAAPGPPADAETEARCRGRFVVGAVSRFTPRKRLDRLVEGFARLGDREGAILLLVGDGPERLRLEEQARRLGVSGAALFPGYRAGIAAYQRLMDVCVVPSEAEPFGLAAIEALALGKPAIVFHDGGGLVEVVGQHEPRDVVSGVEDLAQRLEERRDALARGEGGADECRAYARRFDIRLMAERLRGIYGELAHGRS